jgi:hypothetical protein
MLERKHLLQLQHLQFDLEHRSIIQLRLHRELGSQQSPQHDFQQVPQLLL